MLGSELLTPPAAKPVPDATAHSEENTEKACAPIPPCETAKPSRPDADVTSLMNNRPDIHGAEQEPVEDDLVQDTDILITESMLEEEEKLEKESTRKAQKESLKQLKDQALTDFNSHVEKQRFQRLHFLLEKSTHYSSFLAAKMKKQQEEFRIAAEKKAAAVSMDEEADDNAESGPAKRRSARGGTKASDQVANGKAAAANTRKRKKEGGAKGYNLADYIDAEEINKRQKKEEEQDKPGDTESKQMVEPAVSSEVPSAGTGAPVVVSARQPRLITGGVLREYQLQGVEWMISLYENGLNGILADEMGLGKTLQTISFLAHLRDRSVWGPFLIVAPLSTLSNWVSEVQRFAPTIPVVLYHGGKDERMHIRNSKMKDLNDKFPIVVTSYEVVMNDRKHLAVYSWKYIVVDEGHRLKNLNCKLIRELKSYSSANRLLLSGTPLQNNLSELWSLMNFLLPDIFDDLEAFQSWFDFSDLGMADGAKRILGEERTNSVVSNLHQILQPFLLRRLKTDVEVDLPKKREYLLFAPLAAKQKEIYDAVLSRDIRAFLVKQRNGSSSSSPNGTSNAGDDENSSVGTPDDCVNGDGQSESSDSLGSPDGVGNGITIDGNAVLDSQKKELNGEKATKCEVTNGADAVSEEVDGKSVGSDVQIVEAEAGVQKPDADENQPTDPVSPAAVKKRTKKEIPMSERRRSNRFQIDGRVPEESRKTYKQETDRDFFSRIEGENLEPAPPLAPEVRKLGEWRNKQNTKNVNNMKLQNMIMQLRKVCNHPYLFDEDYPLDSNLVTHSGKMRLLDRLLPALFERGHRVLIFSQMTAMLDIIQGWCNEVKGWPVFRIDGSVSQPERRRQMDEFNDPNSNVHLFLLSTRSGGLGINLTSADTVIIFDSDWNPQMDLQAQDRVHRIGQTKPVVIYRLVTANTIESQILKKANTKRKLEKIVIHKGRFIGDKISAEDKKGSVVKGYLAAELAELLAVEDGEKVTADDGGEVISDENLERLLDRSPTAYDVQAKPFDADREDGQGDAPGMFRVVEGLRDETTDALATRM